MEQVYGTFSSVKLSPFTATKRFNKSEENIVCDTLCKEIVFYTYFSDIYRGKFREEKSGIVLDMDRGTCDLFNCISQKIKKVDIEDIMKQLLIQIYYIHKLGFCHNDIKPNNILCYFDNEKSVYSFTDFGVSEKGTNIKRDLENLGLVFGSVMLGEVYTTGSNDCDNYYKNGGDIISDLLKYKKYYGKKIRYIELCLNLIDGKKENNIVDILKEYFNIDVLKFKIKNNIIQSNTLCIHNKFMYHYIKEKEYRITTSKAILYSIQMFYILKDSDTYKQKDLYIACLFLCNRMFSNIINYDTFSSYHMELKILKDLNYKFPQYEIEGGL